MRVPKLAIIFVPSSITFSALSAVVGGTAGAATLGVDALGGPGFAADVVGFARGLLAAGTPPGVVLVGPVGTAFALDAVPGLVNLATGAEDVGFGAPVAVGLEVGAEVGGFVAIPEVGVDEAVDFGTTLAAVPGGSTGF